MHNDPFAYLEDLSLPQTQAFCRTEHAKTTAQFARSDDFRRIKQQITAQLQDEKQIPFCQEHRARMYHFHQSVQYPKGVYRVCSAAGYRAGIPDWQILFSVADFDDVLGDDVYLDGVSHYVEQPEKVLLTLSIAGADSAYTLEFDLAAGKIVEGGFHFPAGKNHIAWRDEDSVWVCPAWHEAQQTASGYPRQVWLWRRGQSADEAQPVYEMDTDGVMVNAWRYLDGQGAAVDLIESADGFFRKTYFYADPHGNISPLALPRDCEITGYLAGQLLIRLNSDWQRSRQLYRSGSLLAVKLQRGEIGAASVLFEPDAHQALSEVETTRKFVLISYLDNVSGSLKAWKWHNGNWVEQTLPPFAHGAVEITDQPWGGDTVYLTVCDFVTPLTLFALDLNVMELTVLRRQPHQFDPAGIRVQQLAAVSADSTAIPYYLVGKQHRPDTPTLVYAYGGFNLPELPHYMGAIGKHWLEQGGAFVLANIRGGGEFAGWHKAATGSSKHKSCDDLLAVVRDLHRRGYTSPERTAIQGGSNGGLVCACAFVREPEHIGALICEVPLTDMLRYTQLYAGASWTDEYGDPADPHIRVYWAAHSPYQQIGNRRYPPALITTNLADDRVHPAHALKFHAALSRQPHAASWLYAPSSGGHSGNGTQEDTAADLAYILVFLQHTVAKPLTPVQAA